MSVPSTWKVLRERTRLGRQIRCAAPNALWTVLSRPRPISEDSALRRGGVVVSGQIAICLAFPLDAGLGLHREAFSDLRAFGHAPLMVSNLLVPKADPAESRRHCRAWPERPNCGYDFGMDRPATSKRLRRWLGGSGRGGGTSVAPPSRTAPPIQSCATVRPEASGRIFGGPIKRI